MRALCTGNEIEGTKLARQFLGGNNDVLDSIMRCRRSNLRRVSIGGNDALEVFYETKRRLTVSRRTVEGGSVSAAKPGEPLIQGNRIGRPEGSIGTGVETKAGAILHLGILVQKAP